MEELIYKVKKELGDIAFYKSVDLVDIGDSQKEASKDKKEDVGADNWRDVHLGNKLNVKNAGHGGDSTGQILDRWDSTVAIHNAKNHDIECGINNILSMQPGTKTATIEEVIADFQEMWRRSKAQNARIFHNTITPADTAAGHLDTVEKRETLAAINKWIRENVAINGGVLIDGDKILRDPTSAAPRAGLTTDGLHRCAPGAFLLGKNKAEIMKPYFNLAPEKFDRAFLNANPMLYGNQSNGLALGYTLSGATLVECVPTKDAAEDYQILTSSVADKTITLEEYRIYDSTGGIVTPGIKYFAVFDVEMLNGSLVFTQGNLSAWDDGGTSNLGNIYTMGHGAPGNQNLGSFKWRGLLRTADFVMPENARRIKISVSFKGAATLAFRQMEVMKV